MKFVIMILLMGMPLAADDARGDKAGPKAAVKEGDGAKTKQVQTPFGPSLRAVSPAKVTPRRPIAADPWLKIEESGDTITFRRQTPFGEQVWRRTRRELTDIEKEMMAARDRSSGADSEDREAGKIPGPR